MHFENTFKKFTEFLENKDSGERKLRVILNLQKRRKLIQTLPLDFNTDCVSPKITSMQIRISTKPADK